LSREGQEIATRALGQATRRHDVETKSLQDTGVLAAKDHMTVKDYFKGENQSEEKLVREHSSESCSEASNVADQKPD